MSRMSYLNAQMLSLDQLLDGMARGSIAVPEFQRGFVWSPDQVRLLLSSVFSGWPIGSLLLLRGQEDDFQLKALVPGEATRTPDLVVLDGQQRLTALARALGALGEDVFYVQIPEPVDDLEIDNLEELIGWTSRREWSEKCPEPASQWLHRFLPVAALASASDFFSWRDDATEGLPSEVRIRDRRIITDFYKTYLAPIHGYAIPAVTLDTDLGVPAIARIFERVNRTGTRLGAFDLMVARVFDPGWNLRDQWKRAKLENWHVDRFIGDDGMPILESISLKSSGDVRQSAVLALPKSTVQADWSAATTATEQALRFLARRCGVQERTWLPYRSLLIALAALGQSRHLQDHEGLLEDWFWSRAFGQVFEAAANTRVVTEFKELLRATERNTPMPQVVVSEERLWSGTRRSARALWGAHLSLLSTRGGLDVFGEGASILVDTDDEPLLAARLASRQSVSLLHGERDAADESEGLHLRVLGLVLASRETAQRIRRLGWSIALEQALQARGRRLVDEALKEQLLPPAEEMLELSPTGVLQRRLELLRDVLESNQSILLERAEEKEIGQ